MAADPTFPLRLTEKEAPLHRGTAAGRSILDVHELRLAGSLQEHERHAGANYSALLALLQVGSC